MLEYDLLGKYYFANDTIPYVSDAVAFRCLFRLLNA